MDTNGTSQCIKEIELEDTTNDEEDTIEKTENSATLKIKDRPVTAFVTFLVSCLIVLYYTSTSTDHYLSINTLNIIVVAALFLALSNTLLKNIIDNTTEKTVDKMYNHIKATSNSRVSLHGIMIVMTMLGARLITAGIPLLLINHFIPRLGIGRIFEFACVVIGIEFIAGLLYVALMLIAKELTD